MEQDQIKAESVTKRTTVSKPTAGFNVLPPHIYTWFISPSFSQPQAVRRSLQQDFSSSFFSLGYRLTSTSKQSIHLYSVFFSALCQTRQRSNDSASLAFLPSSLTHVGYALQNSSFTASPTFGRDTSSRKSISRTTY